MVFSESGKLEKSPSFTSSVSS